MKCLVLLALVLGSCASSESVIPRWLHDKLLQAERNPGSYEEVWQYEYKGQLVYYFIPACCDRYTELYAADGRLVCYPAGGITGGGDGKCRKFLQGRKNGTLLWKPLSREIDS